MSEHEPGRSYQTEAQDRIATRGDAAFPRDQLDFDIAFFGSVLRRSPNYIDALRCQAELLARKKDYRGALALDRRLVELCPGDCVVHYNLACTLARGGYVRAAIDELRAALANGYDDFELLEADSDLDAVREEPAFQALLREFGIAGS